MGWTIVDDFGDDTAGEAKCFLLGTLKRPEDPGVFRSDLILGEGFIDFSCDAIGDAANMLGWIPPQKAERLQQQVDQAEAAAQDLREKLNVADNLRDLLEEAILRFPEAARKAPSPAKKAAKKR